MDNKDYTYLGKPCRNFNIFGNLVMIDPVDMHEKFVLSDDFIIIIDLVTGKAEKVEKPIPGFAWAIIGYNDEKLIVGSVAGKDAEWTMIYNLDLRTRKWEKPVPVENEQYIWNFVIGSDGMIYGGTWPGCSLVQYDPIRNTVCNLGRVSHEGNFYARKVYGGYDGYLLIECGMEKPGIVVYDFATSKFSKLGRSGAVIRELDSEFICTQVGKDLNFYHPETFDELDKQIYFQKLTPVEDLWKKRYIREGIEYGPVCSDSITQKTMHSKYNAQVFHMKRTQNGAAVGVRGQDYFFDKDGNAEFSLTRIPLEPPITRIMEIIPGEGGILWGSCDLGQTIFSYDTTCGTYWNSSSVCVASGEVIGMALIGGSLFMSSYAMGDHIVYDPGKSWNQIDNINPRLLRSVSPELCRPEARSIIGPDGAFWTGWGAAYGKYGGGLSRVEPVTLKVDSWYDPIPEQNLYGLACDDEYLYITTFPEADGLKDKEDRFHLAMIDTNGAVIKKVTFEMGEIPGRIAVSGSYLICPVNNDLRFFETKSLNFIKGIALNERCRKVIPCEDDMIITFGTKTAVSISLKSFSIKCRFALPEECEQEFRFSACKVSDGNVYFSAGSSLYRLDWHDSLKQEQLALFGGNKIKDSAFGEGKRFGKEELLQLEEALNQNTLFYWEGNKVKALSHKFAAMYGVKHCVCSSSGTAAIHTALGAIGVTAGDEVITSPITDMGTVIGILYQNAIPIFADLDPYTYNLDAKSIEEKITDKTKAIIVVHLAGNAADMDAIMEVARRHDIRVVEDCAQSYLCYYKGKLTGTIGDIGCFSLNDFKHISAGDGGMCIMNDENLYRQALKFTDKNYDRLAADPGSMRNISFVAPNYRMNELQGAVALAQLDKLEWLCSRRSDIGEAISKGLEGLPGICPPKVYEGGKSSYWFYMFRINEKEAKVSREEFCRALEAEGIPNAPGYIPACIYEYDLFINKEAYPGTNCPFDCRYYGRDIKYYKGMCPMAEEILSTAVRIPLSEFYTDDDIYDIINAIKKVSGYYINK